jgi:DNA-binding CsgD family transcriptional regulator
MDPRESLDFVLGRIAVPYQVLVLGFAVLIMVFSIVDFFYEYQAHGFILLEALEIVLIVTAGCLLIAIWFLFVRTHRKNLELNGVQKKDFIEFREEHTEILDEMRSAVQTQFSRWRFTKSEAAVARLLLLGLSIRAIAGTLGKSPRTVQNQAVAAYAKAGMEGRADLTAFFLRQIVSPDEEDI